MAKLTKIIEFCASNMEEIKEEVYNRELQFDEKSDSYQESEKGQEYEYKTEALDDLIELLFEVQEKAQNIKDGNFY